MKYGFEREFFVSQKGTVIKVPMKMSGLADGSGVLVEARSEPNEDPFLAVYLLHGAEFLLKRAAKAAKCSLIHCSLLQVPLDVQRAARRAFAKEPIMYQNMYGHQVPPTKYEEDGSAWLQAGLHVHFSHYTEMQARHGTLKVFQPFDMMRVIRTLDTCFEKEIKDAGRVPGLYEMKEHGFEYRSLPARTDPLKVAELIRSHRSFM